MKAFGLGLLFFVASLAWGTSPTSTNYRSVLEMILARGIQSRAHFFQTEIKFYCRDLKIKEVPIIYSTDSATVAGSAVGDAFKNLWRLCKLHWFGDTN